MSGLWERPPCYWGVPVSCSFNLLRGSGMRDRSSFLSALGGHNFCARCLVLLLQGHSIMKGKRLTAIYRDVRFIFGRVVYVKVASVAISVLSISGDGTRVRGVRGVMTEQEGGIAGAIWTRDES